MNVLKIMAVLMMFGALVMASSTILILDASGSMDDTVTGTGGKTKIEIAKEAANTFLDNVRAGDEVALIAFYDCGYITTEVPFTADMSQLKARIASIETDSSTPIAESLDYAANYAQTSGRSGASIILLTDGNETCDTQADAVTAASDAVSGDIKVVNVVGLGIDSSSTAYTDLQEIAAAGKGKYYSANDAGTLSSSLNQAYNQGGGSCCLPAAGLLGLVIASAFYGRRK